jgi:hypothetical protein
MNTLWRIFPAVGLIFLAGCISFPTPAALKVDPSTPAFKEAVAREAQHQQEEGKSAAEAEKIATQHVTRQFIQTERKQRTGQVAPLVQALTALESAGGCWAYTVTTTTIKSDKTMVVVVRYDPSQPEERLWTLVSRNSEAPDEKQQADYRRTALAAWKKQLKADPPRYSKTEQVKLKALDDMKVESSSSTGQVTFTFIRGQGHVAIAGDIPSARETYTLDANENILRHTMTDLEPSTFLGGSFKSDYSDTSTDYVLLEPDLPPFVSRTKLHFRFHSFGTDSGDVQVESVFSDYRHVKCDDDRFETRIGEPTVIDFIPTKN